MRFFFRWDTAIHVDAASGGFIAPFIYPELEWDFRLSLVRSINVSGHKYGLVYAGIGWIVWKNKQDLPEELIFHINYLGADQPTFTLNFSKGASQIIAQYYQLIRLGFEGYRSVMQNCCANAKVLREGIKATGWFDILSKEVGVPMVAFSFKKGIKAMEGEVQVDEYEVAKRLRRQGWIVPAYTMAADAQHVKLLRVVIREDFSCSLAERLVNDIAKVVEGLEARPYFGQQHTNGTMIANNILPEEQQHNTSSNALLKCDLHACSKVFMLWKKKALRKTHAVC